MWQRLLWLLWLESHNISLMAPNVGFDGTITHSPAYILIEHRTLGPCNAPHKKYTVGTIAFNWWRWLPHNRRKQHLFIQRTKHTTFYISSLLYSLHSHADGTCVRLSPVAHFYSTPCLPEANNILKRWVGQHCLRVKAMHACSTAELHATRCNFAHSQVPTDNTRHAYYCWSSLNVWIKHSLSLHPTLEPTTCFEYFAARSWSILKI